MNENRTIMLMADDDADDCFLMKEAVREVFRSEHLFCVPNGVELMDYLLRRGIYADAAQFPLPDLIFLDLNMPMKDGLETLKEIKAHPELRGIPILIFSTGEDQEQIRLCYKLGASSYITKPMDFEDLIKAVKCLSEYWFGVAQLPFSEGAKACGVFDGREPVVRA